MLSEQLAAAITETSITLPVWVLLAVASVVAVVVAAYFNAVRRIDAVALTQVQLEKDTAHINTVVGQVNTDVNLLRADVHMLQNMMTSPALQAEMKERRRQQLEAAAIAAETASRPGDDEGGAG